MHFSANLLLVFAQLALAGLVAGTATCQVPVFSGKQNDSHDDSPAIQQALAKCSKDGVVEFAAGGNYNVFTPISATNLSGVTIRMNGNLHFPQNLTYMQSVVNASGGSLDWFTFKGSNVHYIGSSNVSTGWIYGYGQAWWDANTAQNPNGTGLAGRPHMMSFEADTGSIQYYKTRKPIAWNVKVSGSDVTVSHAFIDAVSNGSFPFNTDGFDVSGTNIVVEDSVIYNGDDAIAIGDGAHNVTFRRNTIGYQSHGMSIGSLGSDQSHFNNVSNILFEDNTAINSLYGARFKSWIGGQGLVQNVTWKNIRVYNVSFPIFVTQSYYDQGTTSPNSTRPNNSSVSMHGFTWSGFSGTVNTFNHGDRSCVTDPCWYDAGLPNLSYTEAIIIECNAKDSCQDFELRNIEVVPESLSAPTQICINAMAANNPDLGLACANATYIPT